MSNQDHLARAKEYIAKGEDYYRQAADEIVIWLAEDSTRSQREAARLLGRSKDWVARLVQWRTNVADPSHPPFGGEEQNEARYERHTRTALRDPERRQRVLAELDTRELDRVASEATDALVARARAQRAERQSQPEPTVSDLMDRADRFDPSEAWADTLIVRVRNNMRLLEAHIEKWGLVFGTLREDDAFEYMQETERLAGELRAAIQERVSERVQA